MKDRGREGGRHARTQAGMQGGRQGGRQAGRIAPTYNFDVKLNVVEFRRFCICA